MKQENISKTVSYVCDRCGITAEGEQPSWVEFEMIDDMGLRLLEQTDKKRNYQASHLTKRVQLCFCSLTHAREHLMMSMDEFLAEIKPPADPLPNRMPIVT